MHGTIMCHQKHACSCRRMHRPPILAEPIFLGTEFQFKFFNKNFKEEIFQKHAQFEKKIARATGKGVISITVVAPRSTRRNAWMISLRCNESVHQLTELYEELVNSGNESANIYLWCSGKVLCPKTMVCQIEWEIWPPELMASV